MQLWFVAGSASKWYNTGQQICASIFYSIFTLVTHVVLDWASRVEWNEQWGPPGEGTEIKFDHVTKVSGWVGEPRHGQGWAKRPCRDYQETEGSFRSPMTRITKQDNWGIRWGDCWTAHVSLNWLMWGPGISRRSPLISNGGPLISRRIPLINKRSPMTSRRSPLISRRSPLISRGSLRVNRDFVF